MGAGSLPYPTDLLVQSRRVVGINVSHLLMLRELATVLSQVILTRQSVGAGTVDTRLAGGDHAILKGTRQRLTMSFAFGPNDRQVVPCSLL